MKKLIGLFLLIINTTLFSQKIGNKINFTKGQQLEVTTVINSTSSMELMGQSMSTTANSTISQLYSVTDASVSNATLEHTIKRIAFTANAMGQSESFDSEKPEDRNGDIGKAFEKSLGNKYIITVNDKGLVTSVSRTGDTSVKKNLEDPMMGALISQMNINTEAPKTGEATIFKILPDKNIGIGDNWMDSSSAESGNRKIQYTVKSITDKEITLDFIETTTLNTTQHIMGFDAKISSTGSGTGSTVIDRKSGLLKQTTSTMNAQQKVEAQGQSIPSTSKITTVITVKG